MFGQKTSHEEQLIPDQAIEGALAADATSASTPPPEPATVSDWGHPGTPLDAPAPAAVSSDAVVPVTVNTPSVSAELQEIKQHALTELAPLVDHLEQTPEEKFRTTMMMLQASDDQSLVSVAYEAALAITDDKIKAQALLDVINEINYFTQQSAPQQ